MRHFAHVRNPAGSTKAPAKGDIMYTAMRWWRLAQAGAPTFEWAGCGPFPHGERGSGAFASRGQGRGSASFGVRRPLRFLAWKLDLDDDQLSEVARILADLRTERAQAEVDSARTVAAFADAVEGTPFDSEKASAGAALRVVSAERSRAAVVKALERLHAVLGPEQRKTLSYLIRTGALSL